MLNKINPPHLSTDGLPLHQLPEFRGNALEALRALYTVLSGDLRRGSEVAKGLRILRISAEFYIHSIPICISYNIISIHIMCICKINYILVELYNYIYIIIYIYTCVYSSQSSHHHEPHHLHPNHHPNLRKPPVTLHGNGTSSVAKNTRTYILGGFSSAMPN